MPPLLITSSLSRSLLLSICVYSMMFPRENYCLLSGFIAADNKRIIPFTNEDGRMRKSQHQQIQQELTPQKYYKQLIFLGSPLMRSRFRNYYANKEDAITTNNLLDVPWDQNYNKHPNRMVWG